MAARLDGADGEHDRLAGEDAASPGPFWLRVSDEFVTRASRTGYPEGTYLLCDPASLMCSTVGDHVILKHVDDHASMRIGELHDSGNGLVLRALDDPDATLGGDCHVIARVVVRFRDGRPSIGDTERARD